MWKMKKFNFFMLFVAFPVLYILLFFYALIFKYVSPWELFGSGREHFLAANTIPFHTIYGYLSGSLKVPLLVALSNIFGNIILFVPLGIYLQLLKKNKKTWISILIVFMVSLIVETLQFALGIGVADVDDIILNCLGGLIGIFIYRGLYAFLKNEEKARTTIVISGIVVILIPVLVSFIFRIRFRLG